MHGALFHYCEFCFVEPDSDAKNTVIDVAERLTGKIRYKLK